jgi:uncharacterized protein YaiE (UPF0345 family)
MKNKENKPPIYTHIPNSDNDKIVFASAEDIQVINNALEHWETVKQKWDKWMSGEKVNHYKERDMKTTVTKTLKKHIH